MRRAIPVLILAATGAAAVWWLFKVWDDALNHALSPLI